MIDKETIINLTNQNITDSDMFLVEVSCTPSNDIEIVVDSDGYMSIDRCILLSRAIEASMDREAEDFSLTVTSSGVGNPLLMQRQYLKCVGKPVEVLLRTGIKITGILVAVDQNGLEIEYQVKEIIEGKKRKELITKRDRYEFDAIKTTKEELTIK